MEGRLLNRLPKKIPKSLGLMVDDEETEEFLRKRLPRRELSELQQTLQKRFPLAKEKQVYKKRLKRQGCPRKDRLSNTKKRELGLYNISKNGLKYEDLLPLNNLWKQYIESYMRPHRFGLNESNLNEEVSQQLMKADFHGAIMEVHKSVCPNLVGIKGIVVFETRNIIKLLGKDNITRTVPKETCAFKMDVCNMMITFLGKNFQTRPADRSIKKIRNVKYVEL